MDPPRYPFALPLGSPLVLGTARDPVGSTLALARQEEEIITNAGYIFVVLVIVAFVAGGLAFGVREYALSLLEKPLSAESIEWGPEEPLPKLVRASVSLPAPGAQMHEIISGGKPVTSLPASLLLEGENARLQVVYDELWLPGLAEEVLEEKTPEKTKKRPSKVVYTPEEALRIRDRVRNATLGQNDVARLKKRPVRLSRLFRYSVLLPQQTFATVWEAEKAFADVKHAIQQAEKAPESAATSVAILKMVILGASYSLLDNPTYYLPVFNELVETLVDHGMLFTLIGNDKVADPLCRVAISDMVLGYCWLHWAFKSHGRLGQIQKQFDHWKVTEAAIQTHATIFRLLCNIHLGLDAVAEPTRGPHEFRVQVLFREIAKSIHCNDHLSLVPMVAEAIGLSGSHYIKALFYDVLHVVVRAHGLCCMADYIGESGPLQTVVQRGLRQRGGPVAARAQALYNELRERCPSVGKWTAEARRG